jgi:signal transduction histidine kinase
VAVGAGAHPLYHANLMTTNTPATPAAPVQPHPPLTEAQRGRWRDLIRRAVPRHVPLRGLTLAQRFLFANLVLLVVGGIAIATWVGDQLERGIIDRTASITALYVSNFIEPHLESLATGESLSVGEEAALDGLLSTSPLGERIVALKIWSPDGTILYSPNRSLIGQRYPVEGGLVEAVGGSVFAHMSTLAEAENVAERRQYDHLLEMYVPVRASGADRIVAIAEFYQQPTELDRELEDARLQTWAVVAAAVALAFLLLFGIVKQGSDTITRQRQALELQVRDLSGLLQQNAALNERVRTAAERNTTLSERALRRISSDLHDGPGQMLSLALMRLVALRTRRAADPLDEQDIEDVLREALRDMRAVAAGLRLPELAPLQLAEVARRAVEDHARRSGTAVKLELGQLPDQAEAAVKISLFRALQELLSNATRHGGGRNVVVALDASEGTRGRTARLNLRVTDAGPGFDPDRTSTGEGLGLAGIREQAELLGGGFEIRSRSGEGTTVDVWWPMTSRGDGTSAGPQ